MGMYDRKSTTGEKLIEAKPLSYRERKKANSFSKNKELRKLQNSKSFHNKPKAELEKNNERPRSNGEWKKPSDTKKSFDKPYLEKKEFSGPSRTWKKSSDKPVWDKKSNDFKSPMSQRPSKPKVSNGPRKEYVPKKEFAPRDGQSPKKDFRGPRPDTQSGFKGPRKEYGPKKEFAPKGDSNGGNLPPKRDFSAPKTDRREKFVKAEKKIVDKSKYFKYGNNK